MGIRNLEIPSNGVTRTSVMFFVGTAGFSMEVSYTDLEGSSHGICSMLRESSLDEVVGTLVAKENWGQLIMNH